MAKVVKMKGTLTMKSAVAHDESGGSRETWLFSWKTSTSGEAEPLRVP